MGSEQTLREGIHQQINQLPAAELIELQTWLHNKAQRQQKRILSYAGDWHDLSTEDWNALQEDLSARRRSTRRERLDHDSVTSHASCHQQYPSF